SLKPRGKRRWRCHAEESDPRYFARLLRARRERPRDGRAAKERYELPPPHYSITSSARWWRNQGTSSPSALAVLRLITRSNFVGCRPGRSAGLPPPPHRTPPAAPPPPPPPPTPPPTPQPPPAPPPTSRPRPART